jgi:hypothetical protein
LPGPDLQSQARAFAAEVSDLLNGTVTNGLRLSAVVTPGGTTLVGRGLTKSNFSPETIPLSIGAGDPRAWLKVAFVLTLDPEGIWLAVAKSIYSICTDEEGDRVCLHYDYEREPTNEYPAAHVQVHGVSNQFEDLCSRADIPKKELADYHFPVGGRRYRPSLEDVIEFLVVEDLVVGRSGWQDVVSRHRAMWEDRQLRAAVRRNPEVAREALNDL